MMVTSRQTGLNRSLNNRFRDFVIDNHPELAEHLEDNRIRLAIRRADRKKGRNVNNGKPANNTLFLFGVSIQNRAYYIHGWALGSDEWERAIDLEEGTGEKWCVRDENMRPVYELYRAGYDHLGIEL